VSKFHINSKGVAAPCKAKDGNCPFGGSGEHFDTLEEAEEEAYKRNVKEFSVLPMHKEVPKINIEKEEYENFKKQFLNETFSEDGEEFVPRNYNGIVCIEEEEEYFDDEEKKAYQTLNSLPEEQRELFYEDEEGVVLTDRKGLKEIFKELYEQNGYNSWKYKYFDKTQLELDDLYEEAKENPVMKINGEPIYRFNYYEEDKEKIMDNKDDFYDPEYRIDTGRRLISATVASEFRREAQKKKKSIQDHYLVFGTDIPEFTDEEKEYMSEREFPSEFDKINEYVEMKNKELVSDDYFDEPAKYAEETKGFQSEEDIAIINKLDARYEAAKKIVDDIYRNEIYNTDKWNDLDGETKSYWDDYDTMKLSKSESNYLAAKIIMKDFFKKLM